MGYSGKIKAIMRQESFVAINDWFFEFERTVQLARTLKKCLKSKNKKSFDSLIS